MSFYLAFSSFHTWPKKDASYSRHIKVLHNSTWCPQWTWCLLRSPDTDATLFILLFIFILHAQLVCATLRYSREELLDIGNVNTSLQHRLLNFDFLLRRDQANSSRQDTATPVRPQRRRGKRGRLHARLSYRTMLANVRPLDK